MNRTQLEKLVEHTNSKIMALLFSKGDDYAEVEDVLCNFTSNADRLGTSPLVVWGALFNKHVDAVNKYCKGHQNQTDSIETRVMDLIAYLHLFLALIANPVPEPQVPPLYGIGLPHAKSS